MKTKSEKGVTLVALVVTIIVLAVLSGTIISSLNGTGGMFSTTKNMQRNYASKEEETNLKTRRITDRWGNVINKTGIDAPLSVD